MFPLLAIIIRPDNNTRRLLAFNPFNQTQKDIVIRPIERGRDGATHNALSNLPRTNSTETVAHAGDHKETVKLI